MKKLLVIGQVWPEPRTTAAGNRMVQLLEVFFANNYDITFTSTTSKTEHSHNLKALGAREEQIQLNDRSFDDFVARLNPDVVLFDRFMAEEQFGWRVGEHCPEAVRILNTEDLHSLREYREVCSKQGLNFSVPNWLQHDKTKREIASIYRSDVSLLISSFEKRLLESEVGINNTLLLYLPFMLPKIEESTKVHWPSFEDRTGFISFGNGRHAPNVDSFQQLKQSIWPLIRKKLPEAKLHIFGAYLPQQIKEIHRPKEGFFVHGWVNDLDEQVQHARVVLAPLRFGAGIKGKLTTGMQNGTPSVTTSVGAEGMTQQHWPGAIADDPTEIARLAIELYQNQRKWKESQDRGVSIINREYEKESLSQSFFQCLESLSLGLEEHRARNFFGSLLQHQSLNATKYMGKWIEEKHRKK